MGRNIPISGYHKANAEVAAESGRSRDDDGASGVDPKATFTTAIS
jgi:hypothetical protein